ncbi:MAG: hypothetical protein R6X23_01935 [Acidimicrobiia bacterium]
MSRVGRIALVAGAGLVAFAGAILAGAGRSVTDLIVLAVALVIGELFELRPLRRAPLPISFAVVVVLTRAADPRDFAICVAVACVVAVLLRPAPAPVLAKGLLLLERFTEVAIAGVTYHVVLDATREQSTEASVLLALAGASVSMVIVADLVTLVRSRRIAPLTARGADLALVTSGMLMAVGYAGIGRDGRLGLWGPLLFSIPLLAAWYSFELLASTRRNFRQTVEALGVAPELGGLVREGHVERVAALAVAIGRDLHLSESEVEHLETAALLHHLGAVCLDAPADGEVLDATAIATVGAEMLRTSDILAPAGDIVAAAPLLHRVPGVPGQQKDALAGQILKVASAFDELTEGQPEHAAWALEALYTGPLYVYDGRVVGALERVLDARVLTRA